MRRVVAALVLTLTTVVAVPAPAHAADDGFDVIREDVTWTDATRGTDADAGGHVAAKPTRTIPVMVLRPDAPGRHPLVVFIHGVTASGPAYEGLLQVWAAAGYIVAAPTEPLTSGSNGWSNIGDFANQPGDVRFVIDKMTREYRSRVDAAHVAVAGHSLGAITTMGSVYNSCCTDARVDAAIEISGIELPFPNGTYTMPAVPLLAVHGVKDTTLGVNGSDDFYAKAARPAHYLRFKNGGHVDIIGGTQGELLSRTAISFLDRYLGGDTHAMDGVRADVAATGLATYKQKVPPATRSKARPCEKAA